MRPAIPPHLPHAVAQAHQRPEPEPGMGGLLQRRLIEGDGSKPVVVRPVGALGQADRRLLSALPGLVFVQQRLEGLGSGGEVGAETPVKLAEGQQ